MKKKIRRRRHISIINMNKINGNDYDKNMQSDIALCYERKKKKKNTIGNWRVSLGSGVSVLPALPFSVPRVRPTLYWTWNAIDRASDTSWVIQLEHGVAICMLSCKYLYIYIYIFMYIQLYIVDCPFRLCAHYSPRLARGRSLIGISKIELDHFKDLSFERKWGRASTWRNEPFRNVFVRTGRKASRRKEKWIAIEAVFKKWWLFNV